MRNTEAGVPECGYKKGTTYGLVSTCKTLFSIGKLAMYDNSILPGLLNMHSVHCLYLQGQQSKSYGIWIIQLFSHKNQKYIFFIVYIIKHCTVLQHWMLSLNKSHTNCTVNVNKEDLYAILWVYSLYNYLYFLNLKIFGNQVPFSPRLDDFAVLASCMIRLS